MIFAPIAHIQAEVAQFYHLPLREMTSAHKAYSISHPRQVAMFLATALGKSKSEVGRRFKRDRKTVYRAVESVERRMASDPKLAADVEALRESLAP